MEAVPRLPMLCFELKVSEDHEELAPKLKRYIRDHYNEDPELFANEIHQLEGLRASAVRPSKDVSGCSTLKRYFAQLHFLASRFPMQKDGEAAVRFVWNDVYANMVCSVADIAYEMTSILYNIGALHSELGASDPRTSADGMKMTCSHFQCAAWAFQHLHEEYPQAMGLDVSPDLMSFLYQVNLAQAQECILEKSMLDNRKSSIISKVAMQTVEYYKQALKLLTQCSDENSFAETVGNKLSKKWDKYLKFKISYYGSIVLLYQGQQAEEQQKMGERVAFYQAAFDKLEESKKLSKGMDNKDVVNEALTFTMDVVEGKRKAARNENEFIYHEEVPSVALLSEVKGASLVKGIPFNVNDPEVSGPDIFSRIVPIKAHESSSLYSEEKAKLFRKIGENIDKHNEELESFLSTLDLNDLFLNTEGNKLPADLVDRCAAMSAKPDSIQNLVDSMNKLSDTYQDVESMLAEIRELLNEEELSERDYQGTVGKRPPTIAATDLTREAKKYEEAHAKASESSNALHLGMGILISKLRMLCLPLRELEARLPAISITSPEDEASLKEMQHLMGKVEEMRRQRSMLLGQLRDALCQDDITRQLVTYTGESLTALFDHELQKHQRWVSLIEQNVAAQENILRAVKESYARYAVTRRSTAEMFRKRETTIASLISSYDAYEDFMVKSNKGLDFYRKLETNVSKLLIRVKGTCKVQEEEREQILATNSVKPSTSDGLKLKDYLNMKKETGTLSLDYNNSLYKVSNSQKAQWMPGVRPAPVGSEENELDLKPDALNTVEPAAAAATSYYYQSQQSYGKQSDPKAAYGAYYPTAQDNYRSYARPYQNTVPTTPSYPDTALTSGTYPSTGPTSASYSDTALTSGAYPNSGPTSASYPHTVPPSASYPSDISHSYPTTVSYPAPYEAYATSYQPRPGATYPSQSPSPYYATPVPYPSPYPGDGSYTYQQVGAYQATSEVKHGGQPTADQSAVVYQTQLDTNPYAAAQLNNSEVSAQNLHSQGHNSTYLQAYAGAQSGVSYQSPVDPHSVQPTYQNALNSYNTPQNTSQHVPVQGVQYGSATQPVLGQVQHGSATYSTPQNATQTVPVQGVQYGNATQPVSGQVQQGSATYGTPHNATQAVPVQGVLFVSATQPVSGQVQQGSATYGTPQNATQIVPGQGVQYGSASQPVSGQVQQGSATYGTPQNATQAVPVQGVQYGNASYSASGQNPQQTGATVQYGTDPYSTAYPDHQTAVGQTPDHPGSAYQSSEQYTNTQHSQQYVNTAYQTPSSASSYESVQAYSQNDYIPPHGQTVAYTSASDVAPWNQTYVKTYNANNYSAEQLYVAPSQDYMQTGNGSLYTSCQNVDYSSTSSLGQTPSTPTSAHDNYFREQYGSQNSDSMYVQAGPEHQHAVTTTTFSNKTSPTAQSSNLDLLAGLDFNLQKSPLVPETLVKEAEKELRHGVTAPLTDVFPPAVAAVKVSPVKDFLADSELLSQFVQEVEKFEKLAESLSLKTLNGPTGLEVKWKELQDMQEKTSPLHSISVARCYPMKNRFPDILPYDDSRVELPSTKDDYINASRLKELCPGLPELILTQAPLPSTYTDFWLMVTEHQVEVVVCLLSDSELSGHVYWPRDKTAEVEAGRLRIALQSITVKAHWVERILSITTVETRATRVVVLLQFTGWPGSSFPSSPAAFLGFVSEAATYLQQQRNPSHAAVVHCLSGVGRTGLFCLVLAALQDVARGTLPDLVVLAARISRARKGSLRDREHLKFAYHAVLYHCQDLLMKRGILTSRSSFEDMKHKEGSSRGHTRHPSQDFLVVGAAGGLPDTAQITGGLEKLQIETNGKPTVASGRSQSACSRRSSTASSGRSSPISLPPMPTAVAPMDTLTSLDAASLSLHAEVASARLANKKRFTVEAFAQPSGLEAFDVSSTDPLSRLDPLWTIKK